MISNIRPDKAESLLLLPREMEKTDNDKTLTKSWVQIFVICGIFTLIAGGALAAGLIVRRSLVRHSLIMLMFVLAFDVYVIIKFVRTRYVSPSEFRKSVTKTGRDKVLAQLRDPTALGFFIDEDNYDSITVLTLDYLLGANEFFFELKDINSMTVSKSDVPEERLQRYKDEHTRNVLRCVYSIDVNLKSGANRRKYIAMTTPDLNAFFGYINQRAPHIKLTYK